MPYKYLEDVSLADIAFQASGETIEEMFVSAAEALFRVMVKLEDVRQKVKKEVRLEGDKHDTLLYDFLSELLFIKDTETVVFSKFQISIKKEGKKLLLKATMSGEKVDPKRMEMGDDVKAITMHEFFVKQIGKKWVSQVTVDI